MNSIYRSHQKAQRGAATKSTQSTNEIDMEAEIEFNNKWFCALCAFGG
jgi:hypothetical protein